MNIVPIYQIDAFAENLFQGNPAAICPLEEWISDELMQKIAMENNLSETAFFVWEGEDKIRIRFFTPEVEIDLCGHATLATAHLIFSVLKPNLEVLSFQANKDLLIINREEDFISMKFPSNMPSPSLLPAIILESLGKTRVLETHFSANFYLLLLESEQAVLECQPNFNLLKTQPGLVIITAKGASVDFVSRVFGPSVGINEDPVTGSAHTVLIPFWAKRLNKSKMKAMQVSKRGGLLFVEDKQESVIIAGKSKLYLKGEIYL